MRAPLSASPGAAACAAVPGGHPCNRPIEADAPYCAEHLGPLRAARDGSFQAWVRSAGRAVTRRVRGEAFEGAYDEDLVGALLPFALPVYRRYFRVETVGVENIPTEGAAVLAANHSGAFPVDGAMLKIAVLTEHGRNPWLLAGDLAMRVPVLRDLIPAAGNAMADVEATVDLLRRGELVGVFPEGVKGLGKGFANRYRLRPFGRGGFVRVALRTGAPIVPVAIVGAEEAYPMLADAKPLARLLRLPYFPITPFFPALGPLGLVPLPTRWVIAFGRPIPVVQYHAGAADDATVVTEITEQVRGGVQRMLDEHRARRRPAFW